MILARAARALALPGQPEAGLGAIEEAAAGLVGHRLFTVLVLDEARDRNRRFHSSHPAEYPVSGYKPINRESEFYRVVVQAGEARFCRDRAEVIRAFPDHELIFSLGCEGAVNMPVRWDGRTLGSLNLLHRAGHYGPAQLPELTILAALSVAPLLRILESPGP
ncbi:GAF domain-containing protein [Roseococcus sp. YIM B11640]|uniref:GAF domain-containing protein n=1 Tax=Roseococcus sp. YIM B11640 TaxID=3133973 RepID=UPI003C7E8352